MVFAKSDDESSLIKLASQGDEPARHALYSRHINYLAAVSSRYLVHDEDVRDTLQNSFVKIFEALPNFKYRGDGSLRAWMARIVVNESLKYLKESNKIVFEEFPDNFDSKEEEPDTSEITTEQIYQAIRELPDGYRTIFNLYVLEDKSHKEIAELLNITESTSASQFHRAKAILAKKLKALKEQIH